MSNPAPTSPPRPAGRPAWQAYAATAGACAVLSAAAWFFGVDPAMARRDANQAGQARADERQQKASEVMKSLDAARRDTKKAAEELAALPLRLEPASTINRRLDRVAALAADTGLAIDEMQPGAPVAGAHYQTVPIRLAGTGTYPGCAKFLRRLHAEFPDLTARSFECTAAGTGKETEAPPATFRAELSWYTTPAAAK